MRAKKLIPWRQPNELHRDRHRSYLYPEWLPASGEALGDFPIFFHYVNVGPDVEASEMITDVYLPEGMNAGCLTPDGAVVLKRESC